MTKVTNEGEGGSGGSKSGGVKGATSILGQAPLVAAGSKPQKPPSVKGPKRQKNQAKTKKPKTASRTRRAR